MTDQRFNDRLKRINKRQQGGPKADILAGVGPVEQAREEAKQTKFPLLSLILGGCAGYGAVHILNERLGFEGALALIETPENAVPLAMADTTLGGAGAGLAIVVLLFVYAVLRGAKARRIHAFGFAGMAGAMAALAAQMMDIDQLVGLAEPYLALLPAV